MRRSTSRRACRSPRRARVMSRSANGRSSLALASVVTTRPCSNRLVAMLLSIARLWLDVRESCRPLARCRMLELPARGGLRHRGHAGAGDAQLAVVLLEAHAEVEPLALQQLGDLAQRLLAHVLHLQQIVLAELHQILERPDVGVLERVERADREAEIVDRPGQPLAQV